MSAPLTPSTRSRAGAWIVLVLAAVAGAAWWWCIGRPVVLPDAPSARVSCVSYAPFRQPGETPFDVKTFVSPERIDADLRALSQRFDCVRTYSQAHGLSAVPAIAARYHMKVLMGIWLGREAKENALEIQQGVATAQAHPEVLRGVIVGNEVLLRGELSPKRLSEYIREVRSQIPASIPVTYADVWEFWLHYPEMASSVDYLTIHILPYWENDPVSPVDAVSHVATVYEKVQHKFPGRTLMIGETGWPSAGKLRRSAEPSVVNEARYLRDFLRFAATVHMPYNVIEAFDQPWKRGQEGTVGGYWGLFDVNAQPKFSMIGPVTEEPHWWLGWMAGVVGALLFALIGGWNRSWRGTKGFAAMKFSGFAAGTAVAWQWRQMLYACGPWWEWLIASVLLLLALITAVWIMRAVTARLLDAQSAEALPSWLRFGWLFVLVLEGLLLVFDGRYRDFPMGLFALPCVAFGLLGLLSREEVLPSLEQRFLAGAAVLLGVAVVAEELGLNRVTWLWLVLNLAIALPVLFAWRRSRRLTIGLHAQ